MLKKFFGSQVAKFLSGIIGAVGLMGRAMADAPTAPPVPQVELHASLTNEQIQIITAALDIAAQQCGQNRNGCVVGLNKDVIVSRLQNATPEMKK